MTLPAVVTLDAFEQASRRRAHSLPEETRVLPHNLEAERSVLGSILLHNEAFNLAAEVIYSTDFYRDAHRRIFDKMVKLAERNDAIDLVTLKEELGRSGDLDEVGGPAYITALVDGVPRSMNVEHYAKIIKEKATRRRLIYSAQRTMSQAYEGEFSAEQISALAQADLESVAAIPAPETWRLLNDVELMELPDPEFLIDGILPRNGVCVLYGPSGSCKTTLVAGLQVALATGRDWFGHRVCRRGSSVYVATEDVSGFKVRLRAAKLAAGLPLSNPVGVFTFPDPIDLRDPVSVGRFTRFVEASDVQMQAIVVDTYAAATPGAAENSSEDTTLAMSHAQQWRDGLNTAVVLVHHTNASGSRERGHSSMRGAADAMISVTQVDDVIKVECSKQRNAGLFTEINLKLVPLSEGGCVLRLASDVLPSSSLTNTQQKVYSILRDTFADTGATKAEWQRACQDVAERSFHRAAKVLVEGGLVRQAGSHFCLSGGAR